MQFYLEAEGIGIWQSVLTRYTPPNKVKTTTQNEENKNNSLAMETILEGLTNHQKKKIGKCISTKELWLKIELIYSTKEQEEEVMKCMVEDLTDHQKEKIGKCNSVEELSFKINQLNLDEEQKAEDNPIKRSIQDPGEYEGKSPEHSISNAFIEICLTSIENKSRFEFIECDENPCSLISDRNLADTTILEEIQINNEITNVSQEVKILCEQNHVLQEQLDESKIRNQEEFF